MLGYLKSFCTCGLLVPPGGHHPLREVRDYVQDHITIEELKVPQALPIWSLDVFLNSWEGSPVLLLALCDLSNVGRSSLNDSSLPEKWVCF